MEPSRIGARGSAALSAFVSGVAQFISCAGATLGTAPGWAGLGRIVELAGLRAARMLALTGRTFTAAEALQFGLVDIVSDNLSEDVDELIDDILATAPLAQSIIKRALVSREPSATLVDSLAGAYLTTTARST